MHAQLGFDRNDDRDNVIENFRLICGAAGIGTKSLVFGEQVHGTNVYLADGKDNGKSLARENRIRGTDGLITTTPGVTLVTFHADCAPVFIFEPSIKAAALLHIGWKRKKMEKASNELTELKKITGLDTGRGSVLGRRWNCCLKQMRTFTRLFREKYGRNILTAIFPAKMEK